MLIKQPDLSLPALVYKLVSAYLILAFLSVGLSACRQSEAESPQLNGTTWQASRLKIYQNSVLPSMNTTIKSGDLVTRLGTDITSELLRQSNQTDKTFSHCGIASIENDTVFVYHAIGGEFNPDQKMKREPLSSFGHPTENKCLGVFRPTISAEQCHLLMKLVRGLYHAGMPFDMDFDYTTNNRLYCAEMVAKVMAVATQKPNWMNFSYQTSYKYVAVDNLFLAKMMQRKGLWQY